MGLNADASAILCPPLVYCSKKKFIGSRVIFAFDRKKQNITTSIKKTRIF
jgi:hypothetical protein